jgi:uncharacterized protein
MLSLATLVIVLCGLLIGLLLGLTGGGGSILTVPLLVYVARLDAKVAIATSLLIVGTASLAALVQHSRAGQVRWRTGAVFGFAGMAGAYSGGRLAQYITDGMLLLLFAAVLIGSGIAMLRRRAPSTSADVDGQPPVTRSLGRIVSDGFVVGIVTGLVGAGGGFLVVPALALLGGLPMHAAVGTSLLVIAMKCFAGPAGYVAHAPIDPAAAAIVGTCAVGGTLLGTRICHAVPAALLQRGFGLFVLGVAAILVAVEGSALLAPSLGIDRRLLAAAILGIAAGVAIPAVRRRDDGGVQARPLG